MANQVDKQKQQTSAQVDASTNRNQPPLLNLSGGNLEPVQQRWMSILGVAPVDTGATPFPTIPSTIDTNSWYYPGMARSYVMAGYIETPSHGQLVMATQDIPTIQLTIRGPISADVLARWQLALAGTGSIT